MKALLAALCLALFLPATPSAMIRYDFEQPLFSEPPLNVMDHFVVEEDGVYHLFYLRGNPAVNIGHATTTDFIHWQTLSPVVPAGDWDSRVWAPCLYRSGSASFMYFTGVNSYGAQQIGFAVSSDLAQWFKYPDPVYHPDTTWAAWSETAFCHGRDPHVIEVDGTYYMLVTAQHEWYKGAVGCATSTDLIHWTDAGFIYLHSSWHMLESVFVLRRNGLFHMFFTEETVNGTTHMASPTLFGGWDYSKRTYVDTGHAPQITDTPDGPIFSRHSVYNDLHGNLRYALRFSPMIWSGDTPTVPKPFPLTQDWTIVSGNAFFYQPTYLNNAYVRNEVYPSSFVGDCWINTYELYTGPMGFGSPGQQQGDGYTGVIRSKNFSIQGNSISLLVGGGDYPDECYVALVDANTSERLYSETGRNSNVMDRRYWDVSGLIGRTAYIEIADLSSATFGHVCVDDIIESGNLVDWEGTNGKGTSKKKPGNLIQAQVESRPARMLPNTPNPFNPRTMLRFELPSPGHVRIDIHTPSGALVRTVLDETRSAGTHSVEWDGSDRFGRAVSSGVYFARFSVDGAAIDTRKLMLIK